MKNTQGRNEIATYVQWKKIVSHPSHCRRWPILRGRIKRILTSSLLEWARAEIPSSFVQREPARMSNHACAHIQKRGWAFVLFLLLSSPMKFKNTDETKAPLAAIYAWHFEKLRRKRERERKGEKCTERRWMRSRASQDDERER